MQSNFNNFNRIFVNYSTFGNKCYVHVPWQHMESPVEVKKVKQSKIWFIKSRLIFGQVVGKITLRAQDIVYRYSYRYLVQDITNIYCNTYRYSHIHIFFTSKIRYIRYTILYACIDNSLKITLSTNNLFAVETSYFSINNS